MKIKAIRVILAAAVLAGASWYLFYVYGQGSARYLACRLAFEYYLFSERKELREEAATGLSSTYYFTSYYLNGILSAAEGTGSDRILRRAMKYIDTMIATAQTVNAEGRTYRVWKPFALKDGSTIPRPNLHYTFQATVPVARAAAVIMSRPEWKKKYGAAAARYISFVDDCVIQYWYRYQLGGRIPWIDTEWYPIWNDNSSNLALNTTFLYQATGDPLYLDISRRVGAAFRNKLVPYRTGLIWENQTIPLGSDTDNTPGSVGNQAGVPDTSHTNREAFMMAAMYEAGVMFTKEDLLSMAAIFSDRLWNRSADNPSFSNYIDGSDKPYRVYKAPGLNGSVYHGWILMGGYSPRAQEIVLHTLKAVLKRKSNPSLERNISSYGGRLGLFGNTLLNFSRLKRGQSGYAGK